MTDEEKAVLEQETRAYAAQMEAEMAANRARVSADLEPDPPAQ